MRDTPPISRRSRSHRGRMTTLAGLAALAMASALHTVQAAEMRLDFSATIATDWASAGFSDFIGGDTFSGYILFDSETPATWTDEWGSSFEWLSISPYPATLYIDQLDYSFQLNHIQTDFSGDSLYVATEFDPSPPFDALEARLDFDIFGFGWDTLFSYDAPDRLPSGVDSSLAPDGWVDGYIGIDYYGTNNEWGYEYADLWFNSLSLAPVTPSFPPPVLNAEGELLLGGPGLASSAGLNDGDAPLVSTRSVIGQSASGTFMHFGGDHETGLLAVGGDPDEDTDGTGSYVLKGGSLQAVDTQVGYRGTGEFTQSGGSHSTTWLILGNVGTESAFSGPRAVGVGTYNLQGGTLTTGNTTVGGPGQGTFNQTGGSHIVGQSSWQHLGFDRLIVGNGASQYNADDYDIPVDRQRRGTYNLEDGDLVVYGTTVVGNGRNAGTQVYGGRGQFNQSGGSFVTQDLAIGNAGSVSSGQGHYAMSGGSLEVGGDIRVGVADPSTPAKASFVQTGGTVSVADNNPGVGGSGRILIGEGAEGSPNAYRVLGGQTSASGGIQVGSGAGGNGQAVLEVGSGGEVHANVSVLGGGVLTGSGGSIFGDVSLDGGLFAPGSSPGTMSIYGDLYLNNGVLQLDDDGAGNRDLVNISGSVVLGDNLSIQILLGYAPDEPLVLENFFSPEAALILSLGFDPLSDIGLAFTAGSGIGGQTVSYSLAGNTYQQFVQEVPLPAAGWFMLSGLLGLAGIARQRSRAA